MYDAEGQYDGTPCPVCGAKESTIRWHFIEGFDEIECRACGFRSDEDHIAALHREALDTLEGDDDAPPPRTGPLRA